MHETTKPGEAKLEVFKSVGIWESADTTTPQACLVEGLLPAGSWAILAAEAKVGKTWLATDLAVSVATGTPFLGRKTSQMPVIYVHAEDKRERWENRVEGLLMARGLKRTPEVLLYGVADEMLLNESGDMKKLDGTIFEREAGLVILDPMAFLHGLDENSAGDMLPLYRALSRMAKQIDVTVLIVQHMSKPRWDGGGRQAHRIRGTTAAHAWAEVLMYLELRRGGVKRLTVESRLFSPKGFPALLQLEDKSRSEKEPNYRHVVVEASAVTVLPEVSKTQKVDYVARVLERLAVRGALTRKILVDECGRKDKVLAAVRELLAAKKVREAGECVELVPVP